MPGHRLSRALRAPRDLPSRYAVRAFCTGGFGSVVGATQGRRANDRVCLLMTRVWGSSMRIRPASRHACAAVACALAVGLAATPQVRAQSLVEALSSTYNSNPDLL